jgi:site-specific DNA recombinase
VRRGLEGRVRQGRSGGGLSYGYVVVKEVDARGEPVRGGRRIDDAEARIVRRIFAEFAVGRSPRTIALDLNREGIPGPRGRPWGPSTIYGNWRRGTGILNNDLYLGRLVWNRQRFVKDPVTGRRQARPNPEKAWVVEEVPELRIVDDDLWQRVKARQQERRDAVSTDADGVRPERARRPSYLLSGLLHCGVCGGGFSKISTHHYGCSNARNRGTCDNRLTIRRDVLEASVLEGLKRHLMHSDLVKAFIAEYHAELNRRSAGRDREQQRLKAEQAKVERQIAEIIAAIKDGLRTASMREALEVLEAKRSALTSNLETAPAPSPRLHPKLAELYRQKVADLHEALNAKETRAEAAEALRQLIDEIRLVPEDGSLQIELKGDLAAILALSSEHPRAAAAGVQVTLVAGAGFEPATFRL